VGNCIHGDLLDLFSDDVRVVAGLVLRRSRVLQGYTSNAIAGEQRRNTGGRASGYASSARRYEWSDSKGGVVLNVALGKLPCQSGNVAALSARVDLLLLRFRCALDFILH
jgi:hypothetical protein